MSELDHLVQALRGEHRGSSPRASATRARILMSLHEQKHRRRVRWGFGIPLGLILAGSTAWAGDDLGATARSLLDRASAWFGWESTETSPAQNVPTRSPSPALAQTPSAPGRGEDVSPSLADEASTTPAPHPASPTPAPLVASPAPPVVPLAAHPASPTAAPLESPPRATREPRPPAPRLPASSSGDASLRPDLAIYRSAHDAQFTANDCASAVTSYEQYLNRFPQGTLVPEARFNRALCLLRLGRRHEAERALRPFAEGAFGSYRQTDARHLLASLELY